MSDFEQARSKDRAHFADAGNCHTHAALSLRLRLNAHDKPLVSGEKAACAWQRRMS